MRQSYLVAVVLGLLFSWGCQDNSPAPSTAAATPRAAVSLTLLVVDDPQLAAAAKLLRGEWAERSGGELAVEETSLDQLTSAEQLTADVVIYPSRHIGTLVARDWLRPVRDSVLRGDGFSYDDLLPAVRDHTMRYGGQVYAVSLGDPPLVLAWAGESEAAPDTWRRLDQQLPPAGEGLQLVAELIARAACTMDPRYHDGLLFDSADLAPRLTSPPLVRALEEMVARSQQTADTATRSQITWPTSHELTTEKKWHFARLPRAEQVFDSLREEWQPQAREEPLTLLGFAGRSASVTTSSRNATSAFKLLAWLTSGDTAIQLSSRSQGTVWFRNSQSQQAERWLQGRSDAAAATLITRLLYADDCFLLPRIPGIDRYLAALNEAILQAVRGELSPKEALQSAANEWNGLTESLGREQQLLSYRRHLGLVASGE